MSYFVKSQVTLQLQSIDNGWFPEGKIGWLPVGICVSQPEASKTVVDTFCDESARGTPVGAVVPKDGYRETYLQRAEGGGSCLLKLFKTTIACPR